MMSEPTLQQMSDTIAEKLLGWRRFQYREVYSEWRNTDGALTFYAVDATRTQHGHSWQPHNDVGQCFEFIVSALLAKKIDFTLEVDWEHKHDWGCVLSTNETDPDGEYPNVNRYTVKATGGGREASEAIVRAAYEYAMSL